MMDTATLNKKLPGALRALLDLAVNSPHRRYGIAAAEILRAAHHKHGTVEISNLTSLDPQNREAALTVLEACAHPFYMSDRGLAFYGDGRPLLTDEEVAKIPD